jgi:hypothetical protein
LSITRSKDAGADAGKINWGVVVLYLVIVIMLGVALMYSLSLGAAYATFSSSIVTAITTIAGFAVGVNVNK